MNKVINNHYVTRSLSRPWEFPGRILSYYDFETNKFRKKSSESLFAVEGVFTKEEEDFFSKHFETQLGKFKKEFIDTEFIDNLKVFHSPFIYLLMQTERFRLIKVKLGEKDDPTLKKSIFSYTDQELIVGAETLRKQYKIVKMKTHEGYFLFYPEVGVFLLPIIDIKKGYVENYKAFAIPISLNTALCLIPHEAPIEMIEASRGHLHLFSVGINTKYCQKIILPPREPIEKNEKEFEKMILNARACAIEMQGALEKISA